MRIIDLQSIPGNSSAVARNSVYAAPSFVFCYLNPYCFGLSELQYLVYQLSKISEFSFPALQLGNFLQAFVGLTLFVTLSEIIGLSCPMSEKKSFSCILSSS